jgi:hypothetical protein
MYFNAFALPQRHPWIGNVIDAYNPKYWIYSGEWLHRCQAIGATWQRLLYASGPVMALAVLALLRRNDSNEADATSPRRDAAVSLMAVSGFGLLPMCTLGAVYVGGGLGSFDKALFFLFGCIAFWTGRALVAPGYSISRSALLGCTLILLSAASGVLLLAQKVRSDRLPWRGPVETAFRYLQKHPGQAYFPWLPLSHYYAEGRLTHFETGVRDWRISGMAPSRERIEESVPATFTYLVYRHNFSEVLRS